MKKGGGAVCLEQSEMSSDSHAVAAAARFRFT